MKTPQRSLLLLKVALMPAEIERAATGFKFVHRNFFPMQAALVFVSWDLKNLWRGVGLGSISADQFSAIFWSKNH